MEAELTALREELSSRSKNNNGGSNGTKAEMATANHSNISNGNETENSKSENTSVIKKPEKHAVDVKEEDKNWFEFSPKD